MILFASSSLGSSIPTGKKYWNPCAEEFPVAQRYQGSDTVAKTDDAGQLNQSDYDLIETSGTPVPPLADAIGPCGN